MGECKTMYIEPCAGLGNRLLALGSALYWAKKLNRKLVVLWKKEPACAIGWNKLFKSKSDINVIEFNQMPKRIGNLLSTYLSGAAIKKEVRNADLIDCLEVESLWNDNNNQFEDRLCSDSKDIYIRAYCRFSPVEEMAGYIRQLPFSDEIVERVDSIMNCGSTVFGVHIRRTDHKEAIMMSPTALYEEKMEAIVKDNPECRFFIASDDQKEIENLQSKFNCIIADRFSKVITRDSDAGIMDAAIDMLCLSRCKKIIGAYGSTFSLMASVIGNVSLEIIKADDKR